MAIGFVELQAKVEETKPQVGCHTQQGWEGTRIEPNWKFNIFEISGKLPKLREFNKFTKFKFPSHFCC